MLAHEPEHRTTQHYQARAFERALDPNIERFLILWGTETRAAGATHLTVLRRELPPEVRGSEEAARAEGWIIVTSDDGTLLTCYRRKDAWRYIRRKRRMYRRGRPRRR